MILYTKTHLLTVIIDVSSKVNAYYKGHYENTPMQFTAKFHGLKNDNFQMKKVIFFSFAQNIDCGYTLEPPQCGGTNEYPQSMI